MIPGEVIKSTLEESLSVRLLAYRSLLDQLSTLLTSGVPILEALSGLERSPHREVAACAERLRERIQAGRPLAESMAGDPAFPPAHTALIGAAERAGAVPRVLLRLRDEVDRAIEARRAFILRTAYPIGILALTALFPPLYLIVQGRTGAYIALELGIFGGAGALAALIHARRKQAFPLLLRLPVLGDALRRAALGESLSLLGLLVGAGIGVREALEITAGAARWPGLSEELHRSAEALKGGRNLAGALESLSGIPSIERGAIASGERAGAMDQALEATGRALEGSAHRTIDLFLRGLAVAIYLFAGLLVVVLYVRAFATYFSLGDLTP